MREICDENGLQIVLTHTDPNRILNDTEAVIREHDIMGCDYIGIGMMPQKYASPQWLWHFADDYKEAAKKIAAAGKLLMYHNHNIEFQRFHGKLVMDTLLESFSRRSWASPWTPTGCRWAALMCAIGLRSSRTASPAST